MQGTKTPDKIDFELSKTYFRNNTLNEKKEQPDDIRKLLQQNHFKKIAKRNSIKTAPAKKDAVRASRFAKWIISLLIIAGLIIPLVWFFQQKRVVFSVNIHIEPVHKGPISPEAWEKDITTSLIDTEPSDKKGLTSLSSTGTPLETTNTKIPAPSDETNLSIPRNKILYNFENDLNGWEIPLWELDKQDHVARLIDKIDYIASQDKGSLELFVEFPGRTWTAALIEIQQYLNLTNYDSISADVYLPPTAPETEIRGKLILTACENWDFIEMNHTVRLCPGKWVTITADLTDKSKDWDPIQINDTIRSDIRKLAVRIESYNTAYNGHICIDNIRVNKN
ncbi:MAG: glycan-binding surface protein [Candidatus Omnitrophota bacterium]